MTLRAWVLAVASSLTLPGWAAAQVTPTPGTLAWERRRLAEITGDSSSGDDYGQASLAGLPLPAYARTLLRRAPVRLMVPEIRVTANSDIPYGFNDGPMWAGRGWNVSLDGGVVAERTVIGATVRVAIAPFVTYSQNLPFDILPNTQNQTSTFASPWHNTEAKIDLPQRFGDQYQIVFGPGRSSLSISKGYLEGGVTAAHDWWGPALRNPLVMSSNAPGIPRLYLRSARPWRTKYGSFTGTYFVGGLTKSLFFIFPDSGSRSISGALVELRTARDTLLIIGVSRVVYAPVRKGVKPVLSHAFDVLRRWDWLTTPGDVDATGKSRQRTDQIMALSARRIFPTAGFEVYGEWARMDLPHSLDELINEPQHTGAWTAGFQWARARTAGSYLRLQSEITYLEQSLVIPDRPPTDFYTSKASSAGYTQRGQLIGAAVGPGGSSQWIAVDRIAPRWQAGAFVGRIRWENDALYREPAATFLRHDVTALWGLRGGVRTRAADLSMEGTVGYRFNYLHRNGFANPGLYRTVDVRNFTLAMVASPR